MLKQARLARMLVGLTLVVQVAACAGPEKSTVREYRKVLRTYPYSDPNPIPTPGRIYPYFRFDGFTDRPVSKKWKVVEL